MSLPFLSVAVFWEGSYSSIRRGYSLGFFCWFGFWLNLELGGFGTDVFEGGGEVFVFGVPFGGRSFVGSAVFLSDVS